MYSGVEASGEAILCGSVPLGNFRFIFSVSCTTEPRLENIMQCCLDAAVFV
jgi:hypothetical protein